MQEADIGNIKIYGFPQEKHAELASLICSNVLKNKAEYKTTLISANLTPDALKRLTEVEKATHTYFTEKFKKLNIPEYESIAFPEIVYAKKKDSEKKLQASAHFHQPTGLCIVWPNEKGTDIYDSYASIAHELSHGSTKRESRYSFPKDKATEKYQEVQTLGLGIVGGNFKSLGVGIEEGMAYFDQVDFSNQYLSNMYPAEYNKRKNWIKALKRDVLEIDQKIYGKLTPEILVPFIRAEGLKVDFLKGIRVPVLQIKALKEFMLTRKLCEIVGRKASPVTTNIPSDEAIKRGREILDKERYTRTGDAHREVFKILGGKNTKYLFALGGHESDAHIDAVMNMLAKY